MKVKVDSGVCSDPAGFAPAGFAAASLTFLAKDEQDYVQFDRSMLPRSLRADPANVSTYSEEVICFWNPTMVGVN